jgi:uncharacterized protein YoxC
MDGQPWLIIFSIGFFIMVAGFIITAGFLVYVSLEIRKLSTNLSCFIKNTEDRLNPVLFETEQTLRSFRKVSDDVGTVTGDVRDVSSGIREIAYNVQALSSVVSALIGDVSLRVGGIKAGLKAALGVLIKDIKERRF